MILDPVATPDISQSDVYIVDTSIPIENLLGGHPDDIRYFIFGNDSIFKSNSNIKLQAGVDFQGRVGDTLVLLYDGTEWLELTRSLNPLYSGGSLNDFTLDSGYILNELNDIRNQLANIEHELAKIGATDTNQTIHFTPTMSRDDMQTLIDDVKPTLVNGVNVKFVFDDGSYYINRPLEFRRFHGDGNIIISASSYTNTATTSLSVHLDSHSSICPIFKFIACDTDILVAGLDCYYSIHSMPSIGEYAGITIINSRNININNCFIHSSNNNGSGIFYGNSTGVIEHTYINRGNIGIQANDMSRISINDCYSENTALPNYGISATQGSEITLWDNNSPSGSFDNAITSNGGRIYS